VTGSGTWTIASNNSGITGSGTWNVTRDQAAPTIDTNTGAEVDEGGSVTLTTSELSASDEDNTAAELTYEITAGPDNGMLLVDGDESTTLSARQLLDELARK